MNIKIEVCDIGATYWFVEGDTILEGKVNEVILTRKDEYSLNVQYKLYDELTNKSYIKDASSLGDTERALYLFKEHIQNKYNNIRTEEVVLNNVEREKVLDLDAIKIEEYSTIEDLKNMSIPNNIRITYENNIISSDTERSKRKNLKKCLLELCETL